MESSIEYSISTRVTLSNLVDNMAADSSILGIMTGFNEDNLVPHRERTMGILVVIKHPEIGHFRGIREEMQLA